MPVGNCTPHDVAYDYPDPPDHHNAHGPGITITLATTPIVVGLLLYGRSKAWFPGYFATEGLSGLLSILALAAGVAALLFVGTRQFRLRALRDQNNCYGCRIAAHACSSGPKSISVGDRIRFSRIVAGKEPEPIVTLKVGEETCQAEWHGVDAQRNNDTIAKNPGPITFLTLHACECEGHSTRYHVAPLTEHAD